jgi:acyl-CoA thioester hydrolase
MPFVHTERVRFGDLDAMRHLNNVVFLRYFETARIAYLREIQPTHDPANPERDDFGLIFAECHINYRSPGFYDDLLEITIRPEDVRRSSLRIAFEMRVGDRLLAEGWGTLVGYDYAAGRAQPLPDRVRVALGPA